MQHAVVVSASSSVMLPTSAPDVRIACCNNGPVFLSSHLLCLLQQQNKTLWFETPGTTHV
jgi:hypothetical protein